MKTDLNVKLQSSFCVQVITYLNQHRPTVVE